MTSKKTLIAMSGGVDSSVAARLTIDAGFDCAGAMMRLFDSGENDPTTDARKIAERLNIPFHALDLSAEFAEHVVARFIDAYREGRTPNPCVDCNRHLKFGALLKKALELGIDYIATGHYARIEHDPASGRYLLKKAEHAEKDQSYVLYSLTQHQLRHTMFPLGTLSKPQVRKIAAESGFLNADKSESQDICFIPDGDYLRFIEKYTPIQKGRFVDESGRDLGENRGVAGYTIGQRRGLGLAMPYPTYVLELRPEDNTVVVGKDERLFSNKLTVRDINLIPYDSLNSPLKASAKIRYNHKEQPATVFQTAPDEMVIEFDSPQRAITKGQAAVIYDGDIVIGGGTITGVYTNLK